MELNTIWAPVVAALGTLALTIAAPIVTEHMQRQGRRTERRETEERTSLQAVQNDMHHLYMAVCQQTSLEQPPSNPKFPVGTEVQETRESSASLMRYAERVHDDRAREQLYQFLVAVTALIEAPTPPYKIAAYENLKMQYEETAKAVGSALRKL